MPKVDRNVDVGDDLKEPNKLHVVKHPFYNNSVRGFAKKNNFKKSEFTTEVGGWVQVSLGYFFGKSSQNSSKAVADTLGVVYHLYSVVYTLLKAVTYYDLSVLSMSVMGFQKKVWMGGGWVE